MRCRWRCSLVTALVLLAAVTLSAVASAFAGKALELAREAGLQFSGVGMTPVFAHRTRPHRIGGPVLGRFHGRARIVRSAGGTRFPVRW